MVIYRQVKKQNFFLFCKYCLSWDIKFTYQLLDIEKGYDLLPYT